jgi:hypothetical protein
MSRRAFDKSWLTPELSPVCDVQTITSSSPSEAACPHRQHFSRGLAWAFRKDIVGDKVEHFDPPKAPSIGTPKWAVFRVNLELERYNEPA